MPTNMSYAHKHVLCPQTCPMPTLSNSTWKLAGSLFAPPGGCRYVNCMQPPHRDRVSSQILLRNRYPAQQHCNPNPFNNPVCSEQGCSFCLDLTCSSLATAGGRSRSARRSRGASACNSSPWAVPRQYCCISGAGLRSDTTAWREASKVSSDNGDPAHKQTASPT